MGLYYYPLFFLCVFVYLCVYVCVCFMDNMLPTISTTLLTVVVTVLTASSESCDALVRLTPAIENSSLCITVVVIGQRFDQRRVEEVQLSIPAAIIVVAVPTSVVPVVR